MMATLVTFDPTSCCENFVLCCNSQIGHTPERLFAYLLIPAAKQNDVVFQYLTEGPCNGREFYRRAHS